jgi:hypothetical protein
MFIAILMTTGDGGKMIHRDDLIQKIADSLESMCNETLASFYNDLGRETQVIYDQDDLFIQRIELTEADKVTAADIAAKWEETKRVVAQMYEGKR